MTLQELEIWPPALYPNAVLLAEFCRFRKFTPAPVPTNTLLLESEISARKATSVFAVTVFTFEMSSWVVKLEVAGV